MSKSKNPGLQYISAANPQFDQKVMQRKVQFYREKGRIPTAQECKRLVVEVWKGQILQERDL